MRGRFLVTMNTLSGSSSCGIHATILPLTLTIVMSVSRINQTASISRTFLACGNVTVKSPLALCDVCFR
jgi:hypothetical protein